LRSFRKYERNLQIRQPYDNVVLTGLVGLYEICFVQAWKVMKELLEIHGYAEGSTGIAKDDSKDSLQIRNDKR
jgi:hypothetical protein